MKLGHIFLKYCVRYFSAFLIVLGCCMVLAVTSYHSIEDYVIREYEFKLKNGLEEITGNITKMNMVSEMISQNNSFKELSTLAGTAPPSSYVAMRAANNNINNIGVLYTFSEYTFALFRHNNLFLSTSQCSAEFPTYYNQHFYLEHQGIDSENDFKSRLFQMLDAGQLFWRVDSITFFKNGQVKKVKNALLCLGRDNRFPGMSASNASVFVLNPDDLVQHIFPEESLHQKGQLRITDITSGEILLTNGTKEELYEKKPSLQYEISDLNWLVEIDIPQSIIDEQCKNIKFVMALYIGIGLLLVAGLTAYFSIRQYTGIKRLFVHMSPEKQAFPKEKNEYNVLSTLLSDVTNNHIQYKAQIDLLTQQNHAIVLEKMIVHGIHTQEEFLQIEPYLPKDMRFFCIVLVEIGADDIAQSNHAIMLMTAYLKQNYPYAFVNVRIGINKEAFLLSLSSQDAPSVEKVRHCFEQAVWWLTEAFSINFNVGISAIGTGLSNVNRCYIQAKQIVQAFQKENQNSIRIYQKGIGNITDTIIGLDFLEKLNNLLICGEQKTITMLFNNLHKQLIENPLFYEKYKLNIFYTIENIFQNAYRSLGIDQLEIGTCEDAISKEDMTAFFLQKADEFCLAVEERKKSRNHELKERILQYLVEHYTQSSLTVAVVCQDIGISEKYLSQFLKEQTGESFAGCVERMRIEAAVTYLVETDMSNQSIATAVGFGAANTFYRIFNKRMGISPGVYRSGHTTKE